METLFGGLRTKGIIKQSQEGQPLVTVVTVVRNGEKTLEETILSVVNQTYKNIEYIIVDGASTDGTLDIVRKYEDRIDYWISEQDKGIYDAMNKGIDLATGEWINFMNSGDGFYESTTLENIFKVSIDATIGVIYGNTCMKYPKYTNVEVPRKIAYMKTGLIFCHQSSLVRLPLMKRKFNLQYKYIADNAFFYYLYKENVIFMYVNSIIANYEASYGLSSLNHKNVQYENYLIRGGNIAVKIWTVFFYIPLLVYLKIKSIVIIGLAKTIKTLKAIV